MKFVKFKCRSQERGLQEVIEAAILCDEGSAEEGDGLEYFMIG